MGDLSAEPSMEEILSSIKRIIAEEGEGTSTRPRRGQRPPMQSPAADTDEVLELSEPLPVADRVPERTAVVPPSASVQELVATQPSQAQPQVQPAPEPQSQPQSQSQPQPAPPPAEPIVSQQAATASRGSLDALTRLIVKPESPSGDNTLEGLVREMLRPMLRDWLDAQLPAMVEAMVAREIERITGGR